MKVEKLEEIADRRASVHKRIGETRVALVALRETIERRTERHTD